MFFIHVVTGKSRKARQLGGEVTGPKQLGVFGASYVWPVFLKMGLVKNPK